MPNCRISPLQYQHATVVAAAEHLTLAPDQGAADGDAALGQAGPGLLDRDRQPGVRIDRHGRSGRLRDSAKSPR